MKDLQCILILCAATQTMPFLRIQFKIKHTLNSTLINLQCIKHSYYHLWVVCVDLWSLMYFISRQLCFPSRHFQYTEVLLLLWNGYLSGWGCFICRRGWQEVGGCGEFFYWWQNSISSEWLFFIPPRFFY